MILVLNILLIVYYDPPTETVCPIAFDFENGTVARGFSDEYVITTFVLGGVFACLTVWMLLEYFLVTWPHFVMPHFLYTLTDKMDRYTLTRLPARYKS